MFIDCIEIQFLSHVMKVMSETKRRKGKCSPRKGSLSVVRTVRTNTVRGKNAELPLRVARLNKRSSVTRISDMFQMVLSFARLNIFHIKNKNQLDATSCCITLTICSRCFGQFYSHHQELRPDTYPACLHLTSNQQQPKILAAYVVISTIVVSS